MSTLASLLAEEGLTSKKAALDPLEVDMVIDEVADRTDRNHHTSALMLIADLLNARQQKKILAHIQAISDMVGHTPQGLLAVRMEYVYKPLLAMAKRQLTSDQYDALHGSL